MKCEHPRYDIWWGAPPETDAEPPNFSFVERNADLAFLMTEDAAARIANEVAPLPPPRSPKPPKPEHVATTPTKPSDPSTTASASGCAHCSTSGEPRDPLALLASFGMLGLLAAARRKR